MGQFKVKDRFFDSVFLFEHEVFADDRGYFLELFRKTALEDIIVEPFVQTNMSFSRPGTIRGIHIQWEPPTGKLVTCVQGKIKDVIVDLRPNSPSFGEYEMIDLSSSPDRPYQSIFIPSGFGHGFCAIGMQISIVIYQCTSEYNPKGESTILYNDPDLGIRWPVLNDIGEYIVSPRDEKGITFDEWKNTREAHSLSLSQRELVL